MIAQDKAMLSRLPDRLRTLGLGLVALVALGLLVATTLAFAGLVPWLGFGPDPGPGGVGGSAKGVQVGLTLVALALAQTLVAHRRLARLESGQRSFAVAIEDVMHARRLRPVSDCGARLFPARDAAALQVLADDLAEARRLCETLQRRLDAITAATAPKPAVPLPDNVVRLPERPPQAAARAPVRPERPLPRH